MTNQKNKDITEKENQEIGANGNEDKEYVQQFNQDKKKTGHAGSQDKNKDNNADTKDTENGQSPEKGK